MTDKALTNIKLSPCCLEGSVRMPSSKSIAHRALICAALADGESTIFGIDKSDDITATTDALRSLGASVEIDGDKFTVKKVGNNEVVSNIDCAESASTLRFLIPVAAALGITATFTGRGRLPERPISLYKELFVDKNVRVDMDNERLPLTIQGKLTVGKFYIPGNITSQFATGLLFALPLLDEDSEIIFTSPPESEPYIDMTIDVLKVFGITVQKTTLGYYIRGKQKYSASTYVAEGDFSAAAFFACGAAINGDITIKRLNAFSLQGDYRIVELLGSFGARCYFDGNILVCKKGELKAINIDATHIPDLVPVLSVVAAYADGVTKITGAKRLRLKESDRIHAVYDMLTSIGAQVEELDDGLIITGQKTLKGGNVKSYGDHRIAMAAAVASLNTENGVVIDDMSCISKSYPLFLEDFLSISK